MLQFKKTLTIKTEDYSQTFTDIKMDATTDKILELANAISSLQTFPAEKVLLTTYNLIN